MNDLPNFMVVTTDDQGACDYGFAGTCRTDKEGRPVPAPYTPTIDRLAARGKVFPVAHISANWCIPSRGSIVTGRLLLQRGCSTPSCRPPGAIGQGDIMGVNVPTISQVLRTAGPGYCSYQTGKAGPKPGFDVALASRGVGRTKCQRCGQTLAVGIDPACQFDPATCPDPSDQNNPACAAAPQCGLDPNTARTAGDFDEFLSEVIATGTDNKSYLPKKFFFWFAPAMPHVPVAPPDVVEHRPHSTNFTDPTLCSDFLFGFLCDQPTPGQPRLLGPRFPFGAPPYAPYFVYARGSNMQGLYGNVWWTDNGVQTVRRILASDTHMVETATGPARLSDNTVFILFSDNGAFLPRSKKYFTENGYRTSMIIYDPRHETPPGGDSVVDTDIAHSVDVMATLASYAGVPKPAEAPGRDLRGWLENPTPSPVRQAVCGTGTKSAAGDKSRYILPRGGRVGQCSTPTGHACANDGACNASAGELCAAGSCAVPSTKPCIGDDDCRSQPSDTDVCAFQDRKWCSTAGPIHACTTDADCRTTCRTCQNAPSRTCVTDADCGKVTSRTAGKPFWGLCEDAPADKLACTCGRRLVKLYLDEKGGKSLTDLLSDPDETSLVDGGAVVNANTNFPKVTQQLNCCLDQWWLPPAFAAVSCPNGCDPRIDCRL